MNRTQRWFLRLENCLIKSLHIVELTLMVKVKVQLEGHLDYISEEGRTVTLRRDRFRLDFHTYDNGKMGWN